jgi:DNA-binding beta-propeller fold protein YncE
MKVFPNKLQSTRRLRMETRSKEKNMLKIQNKTYLAATIGAALLAVASIPAQGAELSFEHVMNIGSEGQGEGQFKYVEDFAFSAEGHILATDAAHAWVQAFDKKTGKFVARFGGKGDEDANLDKPEGIAVDPDGNIFVADYNTGDIKKYDKGYNWLLTFSEYGTEPGQNIKSEFMDIYDGKLYMPEAGNHRVDVFDMDGKFLFDFGGKGTAEGQMNNPESAKVSSEEKVYVADLKNDRVQVFDLKGKFLFAWGKTGAAEGEFKAPAGIGIDKNDNIYVTEIGNDRVQVFDKTGKFLTAFGKKGSGDGEFGNLHGMIVDKTTGWVYVADTANNRIQVFKPKG